MSPLPLSLFGVGRPEVTADPVFERYQLDPCCWVDRVPGFLVGADALFAEVEAELCWKRGRRLMFGKWYDEPRLTARHELADTVVPAVVQEAASVLTRHYDRPFTGLFCNYYRSGADGVAWHADRVGRTTVDPLVAIISLGGPRTFAVRDQDRARSALDHAARERSVRWTLHSGDLLVMGGATQHHWEHSVPKAVDAPPRISLTTRAGWNDESPTVDYDWNGRVDYR